MNENNCYKNVLFFALLAGVKSSFYGTLFGMTNYFVDELLQLDNVSTGNPVVDFSATTMAGTIFFGGLGFFSGLAYGITKARGGTPINPKDGYYAPEVAVQKYVSHLSEMCRR